MVFIGKANKLINENYLWNLCTSIYWHVFLSDKVVIDILNPDHQVAKSRR